MCVRGASALQRILNENPRAAVKLILVWEPVLATDVARPLPRVLAQVTDRRAIQFWDPSRALSAELVQAARANHAGSLAASAEAIGPIFWDYFAYFPAGVRWEATPPEPAKWYFPVVEHEPEIRGLIR